MAAKIAASDRVEIELALQRLNADFCYMLDHRETDLLADLFVEDAVYSHGDRVSTGRDEIRDLFASRNKSDTRTARHVQTGFRFHINNKRNVSGKSVCTTYAADENPPVRRTVPHLVADFIDEYVLCEDLRWRIKSRHIERIFVAPDNTGPIGQNVL